ncbi:hypothetical protein [Arthrobacter sp. 2MCAF14]|uniref:hypothetical protein n=1 Tax=Arthrobacter sp. 2MCAF14 TaxID=3232982 RepID=UPI003F8DE6D8
MKKVLGHRRIAAIGATLTLIGAGSAVLAPSASATRNICHYSTYFSHTLGPNAYEGGAAIYLNGNSFTAGDIILTSGGYNADKNNTLRGGYAYVNFTNPYSSSHTFTGWVNVFYNF